VHSPANAALVSFISDGTFLPRAVAPAAPFSISQTTLNNLGPFTLNGVEVSDIHFVVYGDGSYDGNKWTNPENGTSTLKIVADFKDVIAAPRSRNRRPGR
jgi:hypothetical protein